MEPDPVRGRRPRSTQSCPYSRYGSCEAIRRSWDRRWPTQGDMVTHAVGGSCSSSDEHDLARRDERDIRMGQRRRQRQQSAQSAAGTETGRATPKRQIGPRDRAGYAPDQRRLRPAYRRNHQHHQPTARREPRSSPMPCAVAPSSSAARCKSTPGTPCSTLGAAARPVDESIWIEFRNGVQLDEKRLGAFAHAGMTRH